MIKNRILRKIYSILNSKVIEIIYIFIIIFTFMFVDTFILKKEFNYSQYFQLTIATSISLTYFLAIIFNIISKHIEQKIEDSLKLDINYKDLIKLYWREDKSFIKLRINEDTEIFPVIVEYLNKGDMDLKIIDQSNQYYELPTFIEQSFKELFSSHRHSTIYNSLNIRLDSISIEKNKNEVTIVTSRTNYFNSMVTNRVMDKELGNGLTIRKIYEFGDKISKLEESKLSNHIGINGIVETKDNKFIFINRFSNVSIGKNSLGCSVAASLKSKYALDENGRFSLEGLRNGIIKEIKDELCINQGSGIHNNFDFDISNNIIAIYRDLLEGGKPQFLFYIRCKLDSKQIESNFKREGESTVKEQKRLIKDGNILFLESSRITPTIDKLIYHRPNGSKKVYLTLPSTSGSVALVLQYKEQLKIQQIAEEQVATAASKI